MKWKDKSMLWEKIFANNATNKGLISEIYKQLMCCSQEKKKKKPDYASL